MNQDGCPLCGSTRFTIEPIDVSSEMKVRHVPGLRNCLDCHDGGAPVLRAEVERLREQLDSNKLGFQRRNLELHDEVERLRDLLDRAGLAR